MVKRCVFVEQAKLPWLPRIRHPTQHIRLTTIYDYCFCSDINVVIKAKQFINWKVQRINNITLRKLIEANLTQYRLGIYIYKTTSFAKSLMVSCPNLRALKCIPCHHIIMPLLSMPTVLIQLLSPLITPFYPRKTVHIQQLNHRKFVGSWNPTFRHVAYM